MLRMIFHDWDDKHSLLIMRHIQEAIGTAKAHLVIVEVILTALSPSPNLNVFRKELHVNLLPVLSNYRAGKLLMEESCHKQPTSAMSIGSTPQ